MIATAPAFPHRLPAPGMLWGDYPERDEADRGIVARLDGAWEVLRALAGTRGAAPYLRFARRVAARAAATAPAAADLARLRQDIARRGLDDDTAERAFALACASCRHTLGVMPYATQIAAARVMLDNRLAEMATGEGKTLAVALAAAVAALGGTPVHVVTANDYLADRDAGTLAAFYRALGLSVAAVTQPMARDARRAAYGADVAYCTARELVFDYLRDGLARPRAASALARRARRLGQDERATAPVLRGLCMALIDEADVVLLDEARVPLV
ncbi:MAG: hypothetical protein JNM90_11265, partial [Burkholderiales bacterium]|nr:hypothetical protein [Burkholderiales bacterium]